MNKQINKAVNVVKSGGIIIYPTDTAFGIGCRVDRDDSVRKLFEIRKRPQEKATPVLVSSIEMASEYAFISDEARKLMKKYWPGGLTIVMKAKTEKISKKSFGWRRHNWSSYAKSQDNA